MPPPAELKGRAAATSPCSQCPFKARQALSSRTSDDDGRLTRFPGKAIALRPTTELRHRSPPALNPLSGFAIERAGSASKCASTPALARRTGGSRHRVTLAAARSPTQAGLSLARLLFCQPQNASWPPPLEKFQSLPHSEPVTAWGAGRF
jgi:hypothetical protein